MINYDTIISAYKDRPTLMQWLKKVEEALKGASATSFSVNKKGNATISFQIDFEDGTSLESGEIILQQGESVTGASIVNGHLILTLSNGDELDAGSVGAVSSFSIDGSQHLIVTYQDGTTNDLGAIFNGNVNISGDLNVTGAISGKSIIETMTGYTFQSSILKWITPVYAGVVKNGNKVTFAIAGLINVPTGDTYSAYSDMGSVYFPVPADIFAKIVGVGADGSAGALDCKIVSAFKLFNEKFSINVLSSRGSEYGGCLKVHFFGMDGQTIVKDANYGFRYELTILLGTNLAA